MEYLGNRNTTFNGYTCQRWDSAYPHRHDRTNPDRFPDRTLSEANNYCRNPDLEPRGTWCYTTDPRKRWEYCDIIRCSKLS